MITLKEQMSNFSKNSPIIATTFNFDIKAINELICDNKNLREKSIIIADKHFFNSELNFSFNGQGHNYYLYPAINTKESFHPKIICSCEEGILRIILGSHNLTPAGINNNLELTSYLSIPIIDNYENELRAFTDFFSGLHSQLSKKQKGDPATYEIKNLVNLITDPAPHDINHKKEYNFKFLHTFKKPLLDQLNDILPTIKHVTICSPILSESEEFISEFISAFGNRATFLTDSSVSISESCFQYYKPHLVKSIDTKGRRLHAKLYVFHSELGDWILFGSPNFTKKAFYHKANDGGNVEAAILLPPSGWTWNTLFNNKFLLSETLWDNIPHTTEHNMFEYQLPPINNWGFENANGHGIIFVNTIPENTKLLIRLFGYSKLIPVIVLDGIIKFKIPSNWIDETRYEVLSIQENSIVTGFLNRSGSDLRNITDRDINVESKILFWHFLRRLAGYSPNNYDRLVKSGVPNVVLRPDLWLDGSRVSEWKPVTMSIRKLTPNNIFSECQRKFDESVSLYKEYSNPNHSELYVRQLLKSLDLYLEGVFYSTFLSTGLPTYLVKSINSVSRFFKVSAQVDGPVTQETLWNRSEWEKKHYHQLVKGNREDFLTNGAKLALIVSFSFNFWLYINKQKNGVRSLEKYHNVRIISNRYYHVFKVFKILFSDRISKSSIQRVWDYRINNFANLPDIKPPTDIQDLEYLFELTFERIENGL